MVNGMEIQGLRFGEGLPKICVPLTGQGIPALLSELQRVAALPADLYEWRIDCFFGDPLPVLPAVTERLDGKPLLCTLRTQQEGDRQPFPPRSMSSRSQRCSLQGALAWWISSWPVGRSG